MRFNLENSSVKINYALEIIGFNTKVVNTFSVILF